MSHNVFGKVIAITTTDELINCTDGRSLKLYEITLSVPEVRTSQASGTPYVEGHLITASMFLSPNVVCPLVVGMHIAANINVTSKFVQDKNRYFPRINLVRFVDLAGINWEW